MYIYELYDFETYKMVMKYTRLFFYLFFIWQITACVEDSAVQPSGRTPLKSDTSSMSKLQDPKSNPFSTVDVSPMDMSYFPVDYPKLKMMGKSANGPIMRIIYSRPHLQNRHIFKDILKLDTPWRLGANESTEIEFFKNVLIQGKKVVAGRYILYCIPHTTRWTLVLNSNVNTWGLQQDTAKDVAHFIVPITTDPMPIEYFTIIFEPVGSYANLLIAWDDVRCRLPITY